MEASLLNGFYFFVLIVYFVKVPVASSYVAPIFDPYNILLASQSYCLVLFPEETYSEEKSNLLRHLADVSFGNESAVLFGTVGLDSFLWPGGKRLQVKEGNPKQEDLLDSFLIFKQLKPDRTCLLVPEDVVATPQTVHFKLPKSYDLNEILGIVIDFINFNCATFRKPDGALTIAGIHRQDILENLFTTGTETEGPFLDSELSGVNFKMCPKASSEGKKLHDICIQSDNVLTKQHPADTRGQYTKEANNPLNECERISVPSSAHFFQEYVSRSKPVILTGAIDHWPAFRKWTNQFLLEHYGERNIHIKITPDGQYEGVEAITLWENFENFKIPQRVKEKLPYPDLVVVRPASMELKFSEFLDLMKNISSKKVANISAYLEYSSIADYFPELLDDISEMGFFKGILDLKHLNIWLSDGNTLGKLHFDPFDNFMCQISGEKQVLLYEPHNNTRLYEAHIQEAKLSHDLLTGKFYRKKLLESTSMVMSPVDLLNPDLKRFPRFSDIRPLNCTIQAGEVLFMPSFWWHEVQSKPNISEHRNLAVNFWYDPFLTKEFPCPECTLDINPKYFHLL